MMLVLYKPTPLFYETATFSSMVTAYKNQLHAHALNFTRDTEDANDLVQDTLIKALKNITYHSMIRLR